MCILLGKIGSLLGLWKEIYSEYIIGEDRVDTWAFEAANGQQAIKSHFL